MHDLVAWLYFMISPLDPVQHAFVVWCLALLPNGSNSGSVRSWMIPGGSWMNSGENYQCFLKFSQDFQDFVGPLGATGPPMPIVLPAFILPVFCKGFEKPPPKPPYQPLGWSYSIHAFAHWWCIEDIAKINFSHKLEF